MKRKTKSLLVIGMIALTGITSIFISNTYAKYISSATATGSVQVAKWAVEVNDTDITPAGVTSLGEVTLTPIANTHVVAGKISPQSTAYGVFTIDPTGAEVDMGYYFTLGTIVSEPTGKVPTGIAVDEVEYCVGSGTTCDATNFTTGWTSITAVSGKYEGTILLPGTGTKTVMTSDQTVNVRVSIKWTDDESAGASTEDAVDDINHTSVGVASPELSIPVTATIYQKVN